MKKKPNWKLMSAKDKAKFLAKNGVKTIEMVTNIKLKECQQIFYSKLPKVAKKKTKEWRNNRELLKKARIPRSEWVRPVAKNPERSRVML